MSAFGQARLPPLQRRAVYALLGAVAFSGFAWILIGLSLDPTDFSDPLRVWRHRLLVTHGIVAYALLWMLGTLLPRHQYSAWRARRNRRSGSALSLGLLALIVTGLMLYYPPIEEWQELSSLLHQGTGIGLAFLIAIHVAIGRQPGLAAMGSLRRKQ